MRRIIVVLCLSFPALACAAATTADGRWVGMLQIPARELQLVVDLSRDGAGAWAASIIIPGLGIKGAPASNVVVRDDDISFDIETPLGTPTYGPARVKAHLTASGMAGEMSQGGNVAAFSLARTAPAQVESAPRSTAVTRDIEDQWSGEFELNGYPRHVTIVLENHANAAATAKFVIVGKQTTTLPVDLVTEERGLLRIESQANHVAFEGRLAKEGNEIQGTFELGPLELPLVLRRSAGRT